MKMLMFTIFDDGRAIYVNLSQVFAVCKDPQKEATIISFLGEDENVMLAVESVETILKRIAEI